MVYLLQVIVYTALMYVVYILFLRNRPMHSFNRAYLLATALLPLVLPFVRLSPAATVPLRQATITGIRLPEVTIGAGSQAAANNVFTTILLVYIVVTAIILSFKIWQWYRLGRVISQNEKVQEDGYTLVINSGYGPGSWGNYIFIPAEEANDTVIAHERAHIQLRHTYDVMLLDIMQVFLWPNLVLIWLRRELVQVHEFQADAIAGTEKYTYAQLLVSSLFHTCTLPSSHSFIIHPIKRRIQMLNKKKRLVPRILALVATGAATALLLSNILVVQGCKSKNWEVKEKAPVQNVADGAGEQKYWGPYVEYSNDSIRKLAYKMPQFPGNMAQFMGENIKYPKVAMDNKIEGRVMLKFVIDKDGAVVNKEVLSSPHDSLSQAAINMLYAMPKWVPGEDEKGNKVAVYCMLPVMFKL